MSAELGLDGAPIPSAAEVSGSLTPPEPVDADVDKTAEVETGVEPSVEEPNFDEMTLDELIEASLEPEEAEQSEEPSPEPPTETEPMVTIKVDGEERQVPLDEAAKGYMRQADYTRKTQELAAQRERFAAYEALEQAFAIDPRGTLEALAREYGIELADTQPAQETDPLAPLLGEEADPLAQEVANLRSQLQRTQSILEAQQEAQRLAAIDAKLNELEATDPELNGTELLRFATDKGIFDLDEAYAAWKYHRIVQAQEDAKRIAAEQKREAKRQAPPVEGGTARNTSTVQAPREIGSFEDAWAAMEAELFG